MKASVSALYFKHGLKNKTDWGIIGSFTFPTPGHQNGPQFANALIGLLQPIPTGTKVVTENEDSEEVTIDPEELMYQWFEGKKVLKKILRNFIFLKRSTKLTAKTSYNLL